MKTVLVLLTNNIYSLPLLRYLVWEGRRYGWKVCVASMLGHDASPIKHEKYSKMMIFINISNFKQCDHAIRKADLIVALLPEGLLVPVSERCIFHGKSLITPFTINTQKVGRMFKPAETGSLILSECGFSPGLDHITAKKAIDMIQKKGGTIQSFQTFSGSVIGETRMDKSWEFRLTESAQTFIDLGRRNNIQLFNGHIQHIPYTQLFAGLMPISVPGLENTAAFPEGNAIACQLLYDLTNAHTVVKGRIIRYGFEKIWKMIIGLGLTDATLGLQVGRDASFHGLLDSLVPYAKNESLECRLMKYMDASPEDIEKLKCLGLFSKEWVNRKTFVSAPDILQHLMEKNLSLTAGDKDNVVMHHDVEYHFRDAAYKLQACLVTEGYFPYDSAMARAVGLTTAAAAKAFLLGNIRVRGFRLPLTPDIYDPVLHDLTELGVEFHLREKKVYSEEHISFNLNLN